MKIFSGSANIGLAEEIVTEMGIHLSSLEIHTFPDSEKRVRVEENIVDADCVIIEPTSPPVDQNYMELFFILDSLKRSGAKRVTAVIPYLGYQRQDHIFRDGEAVSLDVVIKTMETNGVDEFVVCDLHSIKIPELFHKPVIHISALSLFAKEILSLQSHKKENSLLVSPDMGGIRRIKILSELLGGMAFVTVNKDRDLNSGAVTSNEISGDVGGKTAFVVDDMISSGGTIKAACDLLEKKGAVEIYVFATHPVFSESTKDVLTSCKAKKIYVTNSIHIPTRMQFETLHIISIASLIKQKLS